MTRHVLIDWSSDRLVVYAAELRQKSLASVTHETLSLDVNAGTNAESGATGDTPAVTDTLGSTEQRLSAALSDYVARERLAKSEAVVLIDRRDVELRRMTLPPGPDAELPDMVRFQAMRDLNLADDTHVIDFQPLGENTGSERDVLAAAMPSAQLRQIEAACTAAGLSLRKVVVRPCGLTALPLPQPESGAQLVVDLADADQAGAVDMLLTLDRQVVLMRTIAVECENAACETGPLGMIPAQTLADWIVPEMRRMLLAASSQLGGTKVGGVVLLTGEKTQDAKMLAAELHRAVSLPIEQICATELHGLLDTPAEFDTSLAVLGHLCNQLENGRSAFDFMNPRQPPKPVQKHTRLVIGGLVGVTLLLTLLGWSWYRGESLKDEIARLGSQKTQLTKALPKADAEAARVKLIDQWHEGQHNWAEQMRWLSQQMPDSEQVVLTRLTISSSKDAGQFKIAGLARDDTTFDPMERQLQDSTHTLISGNKAESDSHPRYGLQFDSTVIISASKPSPKSGTTETKPVESVESDGPVDDSDTFDDDLEATDAAESIELMDVDSQYDLSIDYSDDDSDTEPLDSTPTDGSASDNLSGDDVADSAMDDVTSDEPVVEPVVDPVDEIPGETTTEMIPETIGDSEDRPETGSDTEGGQL